MHGETYIKTIKQFTCTGFQFFIVQMMAFSAVFIPFTKGLFRRFGGTFRLHLHSLNVVQMGAEVAGRNAFCCLERVTKRRQRQPHA